MISGKNILVTGGAGFIATHVVDRLLDARRITLLDIDLANALPFTDLADRDNVRTVEGDVRDSKLVHELVMEHDIVLHFASLIGVQHVMQRARDTIDTIILGTRNVLEACAQRGKIDRLIYISTSEVYGNIMNATEGAAASVGTANDSRLCYASAKLMGEHQVWAYHRDFGLPTVIIRPFNIYGARRKAGHAVGYFVVKALAGSDITVHGDGSQLRSWCYIDDFADGIAACINREEAIGQDYNLGNPVTATTIYDLAQRIIRLAESPSRIVSTPYTFNDIGVRAPNSQKAREHLDYEARFDLEEGLTRTIAWYREHLSHFQHWR